MIKKIQTNLGSYSYKCAIVLDCLLQMVFPYGPTLMGLHVENTMEIVWLTMCYFPKGLDLLHKFSLGEWTVKSDRRALCIYLKCIYRFDCEKDIEDNKQLHLSMNLK